MKFDSASAVNEVVWQMRLADLPRGENRAILQRLYNGDPPYSEDEAEENDVEINRNTLSGVNLLTQGRTQWNNAMLRTGPSVTLDSGPTDKRASWSSSITKRWNQVRSKSRAKVGQIRSTGANVMLHGIGPCNWQDRRSIIAKPIPVSSLMIPSDTDIDDFDNLPYFAVFREWTAQQLYELTHGPKRDPGWQMGLVDNQLNYIKDQIQKGPNATAYQYMPERVEDLAKQDLGFWGSDAVPTVDVWDFYFREEENGKGWYRRVILDWGFNEVELGGYKNQRRPARKRKEDDGFLYDSKKRKYANSISEILWCSFGDCSAYAPFKYHDIRSLGWMLWGICDLENRMDCRFNEAIFEQLMWFFRVAGQNDMQRIKKANFRHLGVIPNGVAMLTADERFKPDGNLIQMAFERNRARMDQSAAAYTQGFDRSQSDKEMTATETMARVQAINTLVSGMMDLAYVYEEFNDREEGRRLCIKNNPDPMARKFRTDCLRDGVAPEMLDVDRWNISHEKVLGGGNKTVQMGIVNYMNTVRKNLPPRGQRLVDHYGLETVTDQPDLAEEMAPLNEDEPVSKSVHDAQEATPRLLAGLPFSERPDMLYEDYVKQWLQDLTAKIQMAQKSGGMATQQEIMGFANMGQHIGKFLEIMAQNDEDKPRVTEYQKMLSKLMNFVKAFQQRLQQQQKAQQGANGQDPKAMAQIQGKMLIDKAKADNMVQSHAMRTAQKQASFEMEQQRKDRELNADIRRNKIETQHELINDRFKALRG